MISAIALLAAYGRRRGRDSLVLSAVPGGFAPFVVTMPSIPISVRISGGACSGCIGPGSCNLTMPYRSALRWVVKLWCVPSASIKGSCESIIYQKAPVPLSSYVRQKAAGPNGTKILMQTRKRKSSKEIGWKNDNTLARPYFKDKDIESKLRTFKIIVVNPPFSDKACTNGVNVANDPYGRFKDGTPSAKSGDYVLRDNLNKLNLWIFSCYLYHLSINIFIMCDKE